MKKEDMSGKETRKLGDRSCEDKTRSEEVRRKSRSGQDMCILKIQHVTIYGTGKG